MMPHCNGHNHMTFGSIQMRYTPKLPFVSESEHGDKPLDFGETYFQNNMASGLCKTRSTGGATHPPWLIWSRRCFLLLETSENKNIDLANPIWDLHIFLAGHIPHIFPCLSPCLSPYFSTILAASKAPNILRAYWVDGCTGGNEIC